MNPIAERLRRVREAIAAACAACDRDPGEIELLPVTKRQPAALIRAALALGLSTFGENRVQELDRKAGELAGEGLAWQMIGSVQTNKVRALLRVEGLALLQTLDRRRLADALQIELHRRGRRLPVLLQVDATGEEAKHGVAPEAAADLLRHLVTSCPNLDPVGVMAMGPRQGDPAPVFAEIDRVHRELRQDSGLALPVRSLGMSGDLAAAIAAGSTMVRVGTGLFGARGEGGP